MHVDHRSRARFALNDNDWSFDPNLDEAPAPALIPMTATTSHPTNANYPDEIKILSSYYIQSCHPANQCTRFLYQYFYANQPPVSPPNMSNDPVNNDQTPLSSQYKSTPDDPLTSRASSASSYVILLATSILWYNNID